MTDKQFVNAKELAASGLYRVIPIYREMYADSITPIVALRILKSVSRHCYLLESAEANQTWGRYSFLGFDPILELNCRDHKLTLKSGMTLTEEVAHPKEYIRKILKDYKSPKMPQLPPFTGGLVGYFSYDYIKYSEPTLDLAAEDEESFNDVDLMLFDQVIAFDNYRQKIVLIVNARVPEDYTEKKFEVEYQKAQYALSHLIELLKNGKPSDLPKPELKSELKPLFDLKSYCKMVERGKHYIQEGDIFQVVLSNRFQADFDGSLLDAYRVLRTTNPSPYMFYFSSDDIEIAGASPETLVKLQGEDVTTFPLAGTRPRGKTEQEDQQLEKELLADEKERAEHNMLVDLGRNDIGKISKFGSVSVSNYMSVERYSHVMHIGSTVHGSIRPEKDALDAVDAILPAGTLSGAPKIRACEIIHELEQNKRGIYGGAIGYLDFTGNLDVCIAIRLAFAKNHKLFIRSGAGIVADSVPEKEYQECVNKAQAVVSAVKLAVEGIEP